MVWMVSACAAWALPHAAFALAGFSEVGVSSPFLHLTVTRNFKEKA